MKKTKRKRITKPRTLKKKLVNLLKPKNKMKKIMMILVLAITLTSCNTQKKETIIKLNESALKLQKINIEDFNKLVAYSKFYNPTNETKEINEQAELYYEMMSIASELNASEINLYLSMAKLFQKEIEYKGMVLTCINYKELVPAMKTSLIEFNTKK